MTQYKNTYESQAKYRAVSGVKCSSLRLERARGQLWPGRTVDETKYFRWRSDYLDIEVVVDVNTVAMAIGLRHALHRRRETRELDSHSETKRKTRAEDEKSDMF